MSRHHSTALAVSTPTLVESITRFASHLTLVESPPKRVLTVSQKEALERGRAIRTLNRALLDAATIAEREAEFSCLVRLYGPKTNARSKRVVPVTGARGKKAKKPFTVGMDLAIRGIEVRKLFYAAFARGLVKDGYDPEECLQEVYKGLLTRNNGTCPFDSRKSSFGHYVHIVTRCVLANYIRKEKRRLQFESNEASLGGGSTENSFSIEGCPDRRTPGVDEALLSTLSRSLGCDGPVEPALRLLTEGYSRREVVSRLKVETKWLDGVLQVARGALTA